MQSLIFTFVSPTFRQPFTSLPLHPHHTPVPKVTPLHPQTLCHQRFPNFCVSLATQNFIIYSHLYHLLPALFTIYLLIYVCTNISTLIMRVGNIYARVTAKGHDWNFLGLESANYPLPLCKMTNSKYPLGIMFRTLVRFCRGLRLRYFY